MPNRNVSYRQFGNSVVVNVLKAIIGNVVESRYLDRVHTLSSTKSGYNRRDNIYSM